MCGNQSEIIRLLYALLHAIFSIDFTYVFFLGLKEALDITSTLVGPQKKQRVEIIKESGADQIAEEVVKSSCKVSFDDYYKTWKYIATTKPNQDSKNYRNYF